jgi:hypothetical protein
VTDMKACLVIALACCAPLARAGSCVDKHARDPTFVALAVPENAPRPADVSAFSAIDETVTVEKLTAKIGPPDGSMGETISILVWCLPDGEVRVTTRDGSTIDQVRHNGKLIYAKKKK